MPVNQPDLCRISSTVCLELHRDARDGSVWLVQTVPGRDGAMTRHWETLGAHGITAGQLQDIVSAVLVACENWLLASGGGQRELW